MGEREIVLPRVGDVYAVPLKKGTWGACWVVRRGRPGSGTSHLGPFVVVVGADWFGRDPPTMVDLRAPKVLRIDHINYQDEPTLAIFNVNEPVAKGMKLVGRLDEPVKVGSAPWVAGWERIAYLLDQQRAWNVDRKASVAGHEAVKAGLATRGARGARAGTKKATARRSELTLGKLRKAKLLRTWDGAMPPARVVEGRAMLVKLMDRLEERAGDTRRQLASFRAAVVGFNRWNDKHGVIETAEREALHEALADIGTAAKLEPAAETIEDARDW